MRRSAIRTLLFALVLVCPAPASLVAQAGKADPARSAIESAGKAFVEAYNRGDIPAVARTYAEDAIAFPPDGDMVKGRAAIEALWKGIRDTGVKTVDFEVIDVTSSGNLAAETGIATLQVQGMGAVETTLKVKYVVVWKKQGGSWKIIRDIWNSMAPAAAAAPATAATPAMATTPAMPTTPHH
jgi:uncharacterized protein (TIGR02246 family)